ARTANRQSLGALPAWVGADIWNAYEVSWLNARGKPTVAMARFVVPQDSPHLIESKSFKLYLNSFNEERFEDWDEVQLRMQRDLSAAAGAGVSVELIPLSAAAGQSYGPLDGKSLD